MMNSQERTWKILLQAAKPNLEWPPDIVYAMNRTGRIVTDRNNSQFPVQMPNFKKWNDAGDEYHPED